MEAENSSSITLNVKQSSKKNMLGDVIRVHESHTSFASSGQVIKVSTNGKTIYANLRRQDDEHSISIDKIVRERLNLNLGESYEFTFAKTGWFADFRWAWYSSDAMPRVAARSAIISLSLGLLGLIFGIIALCK